MISTILLAAATALCSVESGLQPAIVVELFTSQGCSSCPPADQWLGTLRERHGDGVIPLSMHVGYWDYIGWKDPFARREFNDSCSPTRAARIPSTRRASLSRGVSCATGRGLVPSKRRCVRRGSIPRRLD